MCIHCPSFLHSVLQNSCLNRQQRGIEATTVNRTASWSWSQTTQETTQLLVRLQANDHACQAVRQVTLKSSLTQPLLARFTSRRHPNQDQDSEASRRSRLSDVADDLEIMAASTAASASIYVSSSSESEDQDSKASRRSRLSDVESGDSEIIPSTAVGAPIYVSSSSESDDQDSGALVPGRKPYSIGLQELPASLREFLGEAYAFFTSSHRLERAGQRVSLTTYGKAQERILCEYCQFISLK